MDFSHFHIVEWFERALDALIAQWKKVLLAAAVVAVVVAGYFGYQWYFARMQQKAHYDLMQVVKVFEGRISRKKSADDNSDIPVFASSDEKWQEVERVCDRAFEQNKGSGLAGIFLTYKADALQRLDKPEKAIEALSQAIELIKSQELKDFYSIKNALVKIDSGNERFKQEGVQTLVQAAQTPHHYAHEQALYHVGYYFWTEKDFAQAKNYWQELLVKYSGKDSPLQSGYADLVKPKLKLISADF
ncbi:MAG: hypothetical protein H6679_04515 [Epsilonproteobacteria bacterium]|nr:hypothetical protein [Campylobacterota bacterium]